MTERHADSPDCQRARQTWHDRADDLAKRQDVASMQAHLGGCGDCRRYVRQMELLGEALVGLRMASEGGPPQSRRRPRRPVRTHPRAAAIAAGLVLVVGVGLYFSSWRRPGDRVATVSQPPGRFAPQDLPRADSPSDARTDRTVVQLRGESARAWMIELRGSDDPRVHIYRLYPMLPLQSEMNESSAENDPTG